MLTCRKCAMMQPIIVLLVVLAMSANAAESKNPRNNLADRQSEAPKIWESEPATFLGLDLGTNLRDQKNIVECPNKVSYIGSTRFSIMDSSYKGFCYDPKNLDIGLIYARNGPDLGVPYHLELLIKSGEVHGAIVTLSRPYKDNFLELLTNKYGNPHKTVKQSYQNKMGASFEGLEHIWSGKTVFLKFSEYGDKLTQSEFSIQTKTYIQSGSAESKEKAERLKGNL